MQRCKDATTAIFFIKRRKRMEDGSANLLEEISNNGSNKPQNARKHPGPKCLSRCLQSPPLLKTGQPSETPDASPVPPPTEPTKPQRLAHTPPRPLQQSSTTQTDAGGSRPSMGADWLPVALRRGGTFFPPPPSLSLASRPSPLPKTLHVAHLPRQSLRKVRRVRRVRRGWGDATTRRPTAL
jgi:hypothetical protein